ncbi:MAG: NAD(P)H-dependent glycerol-3-phosphate dehydrogenase [Candidatus Aminicenantes bacterium]|nr:NAD(P)H-dependent glycerol-3-phosphate dehydrogenase [Candidatus Aminicenantes bacterium]MDH5742020.1 NAD(P)H-dependent glycerol-3-phosphate dehydrogenase [Candidatus Aminicenantes bacterium]
MAKMTFVGAGSYGTAVASHFAKNSQNEVMLFGRNREVADEINRDQTNSKYLGTHKVSHHLKATSGLQDAVQGADFLFIAVPAQEVRNVTRLLKDVIKNDSVVINLAKGIEVESLKRMSQVISEELKGLNFGFDVMTLSGPSFAEDVVNPEKSVALTLGGKNRRRLKSVRNLLHSDSFRVFACKDLVGVEMGGALKNVFAIMAGIMKGAGEGNSYLGEFIPRALVEIDTIKRYFGARRDTSRAVSSLGDLIISCSEASRNFRFGRAYSECCSRAKPGDDAVKMAFDAIGNKTVEGYYTLRGIYRFVDEKNMFAPIVRELYDILYDSQRTGKGPTDAIASFRQADSLRTWENLRTYSRMLGSIFPQFWYRRYTAGWKAIKKEIQKNR